MMTQNVITIDGKEYNKEDDMQTMLDDQMIALANPPMRQAVPAA